MIEKIHIIVAIFAALAITILSLFQDITFYALSIRLVIIIPVFFILGLLFRIYFKKLFAPPVIENEENPESVEEAPEVVEAPNEAEQLPEDIDYTDEDYD